MTAIEKITPPSSLFDSLTHWTPCSSGRCALRSPSVGARLALKDLSADMSLSTRTRQWIELAASLTRADFVRRYPGYFLVCEPEAGRDVLEVRWIRLRMNGPDTNAPICVGRSPKCDIPLIHPSISNRHAQLFVAVSGRPTAVTDLGSHNGTRLNGRPIPAHAREPLAESDTLQLGSVRASIVESDQAYSLLAGLA